MKSTYLALAIAALINSSEAIKLESSWGVKDLTDEKVAFAKLPYLDQEKSEINDSLAEAEAELGHKLGSKDTSTPKTALTEITNASNDAEMVDHLLHLGE